MRTFASKIGKIASKIGKNIIDEAIFLCYSRTVGRGLSSFFCAQNEISLLYIICKRHAEVERMRTKITLACTECKNRNYNMTKDKKTHPDRMETKKYCKFCKTHTLHKETK